MSYKTKISHIWTFRYIKNPILYIPEWDFLNSIHYSFVQIEGLHQRMP